MKIKVGPNLVPVIGIYIESEKFHVSFYLGFERVIEILTIEQFKERIFN